MKHLLLFTCLLLSGLGLQAQVYVDIDATGANDGTSWADAYTSPDSAFANAPNGSEIWVAEGTYTISTNPTTGAPISFFIDSDVDVIGGFNGTETSAGQSDPVAFETIFSGDVLGNDGPAYDSLAYEDNGRVFLINDTAVVTGPLITVGLRNLTVANGGIAVDEQPGDNFQFFAGAGILSYARLDVDNVTIRDCRASNGSALALLFETTQGSRFNDLTIVNNQTFTQRTIYVQQTTDIEFNGGNYQGTQDTMISGMFVASLVDDMRVIGGTFTDIYCGFTGAVGRFNDCDDILFDDCTITDVLGSTGGALYFIQSDAYTTTRVRDANDHVVRNTTISKASGTGRGGAIAAINSSATLDQVTIDSVSAGSIGGAVYTVYSVDQGQPVSEFVMNGGSITNTTAAGVGGAICNLLFDSTTLNSSFTGVVIDNNAANNGGSGGGAMYHQIGATASGPMSFDKSSFTANRGGDGSAILVSTDGVTPLDFTDCTFRDNVSSNRGTLSVFTEGLESHLTLNNTVFFNNLSESVGGAMLLSVLDGEADLTLNQVTVDSNRTNDGTGGGIIFFNTSSLGSLTIEGSVFRDNEAGGDGNGGGLATFTGPTTVVRANDVTFEANKAEVGSGWFSSGETDISISNATFESNGGAEVDGPFQGGAMVVYAEAPGKGLRIDSSEFNFNTVAQTPGILSGGGAMYLLNREDLPENALPLVITDCEFNGNTTTDDADGGALYLVNGWDATFRDNRFTSNSSGGDGGAINVIQRSSRDTINGEIIVTFPGGDAFFDSNLFDFNISGTQGGAISTQAIAPDFTNNIFLNNSVSTDGASGGALIINGNSPSFELTDAGEDYDSVGTLNLVSTMIHNTFFNNRRGGSDGAVGQTVALFQPGETEFNEGNSLELIILNNAFLNDGGETSIEFEPSSAATADLGSQFLPIGDLTITSLGGNYFAGEVGEDDVTVDSDTENEDAEDDIFDWFVDPESDLSDVPDFSLVIPPSVDDEEDFPLIEHGVNSGFVPDLDYADEDRVVGFFPDAGAREADYISSTAEPIEESGLNMSFFPNPTQDVLNITNETSVDRFQVIVADNTGRILSSRINVGVNSRVDFSMLPAGIYNLQLILDGKAYSKQIVKK